MALDPQVKVKNPDGSLRTQAEVDDDKLDARTNLLTKISRLIDKCACCLKEQELRKDELVIRTPHHTDYYIDYDNGNDGNNGLGTGTAYKTITKYTTTEVRSAGDKAFLRANITWDQGTEAVDITFDEDGTADSYIELIGCDSVTNDPWGDASDTKPIIDFQNATYNISLVSDEFWRLNRLNIQQSNDTNGAVYVASGDHSYILDCDVLNSNQVSSEGLFATGNEFLTVDGCTFLDCNGSALSISSSRIHIRDCTFTAGVDVSTNTGLNVDNSSIVWLQDSTFTGAFDDEDIRIAQNSTVYARNVTWSASGKDIVELSELHSEDDDGTFEAHIATFEPGVITRDTGTVRGGGADSSAKMEPGAACGPNFPLVLGDRLRGFRPIWVTAGSYTATVYARVGTAWDSALTAAECYLITSELDNAGNATRVERQSAQTIANDTTWTALTTSISPARDGFVYFWLYLAEYEDATEHIFVDILPTVA
jgi:hypothetical protein